jgi:hypothetical protein
MLHLLRVNFRLIFLMKDLFDSQYRELKLAIKPYKKDWNDWTRSRDCFLEKEEIIAVNEFLNLRGNAEPAEIMQYIRLKNAITKLSLFLEIFKKYQKVQKARKKKPEKHKKTGRVSRS